MRVCFRYLLQRRNRDPSVPAADDEVIIMGWGLTDVKDDDSFSPVLKQASLFVVSNEECEQSRGDGLCCDYGEGKYQVSLGTNDISDTSAIIIESQGVFQYRTAHTFLASVHSEDGLCKGPGSSCSFLGSCDDCCNEASCSFSGCKCL
jgi:hypothetical protein